MKRTVSVIGIGAGDPEYVTVQAIKAMNRASVFFIPEKGSGKAGLADLRRDICERYIEGRAYRMVDFDVPPRPKPSSGAIYKQSIAAWRAAVEAVYERLLTEELGEDERGAFLIWGDPSLYDGTLRILDSIGRRGALQLDYDVVPGITSVQALAARHRTALNRIGEPVLVTTGRRLARGFPEGFDSVVVMLDGEMAFRTVDGDCDIQWGAYLGTPDEILISGRLDDVADEIERARTEAREKHGWIMDTYRLTKPRGSGEE